MTISYELAPMPKWYIADATGRPLGGGYMATYNSKNKTIVQPVYQDQAGNFPWPYANIPNTQPSQQGVLFDENGSQGPFYWKIDSDNPEDTYYLEIYDSSGVLQWTIDNFIPPATGGGGDITEVVSVDNLIVNNVMWRNFGQSANPIATTFLKVALGAHAGFTNNAANSPGIYTGSDICFVKNNTNATDQLSFQDFSLGSTALTGDVTPPQFLRYVCTNTPASETIKCIQFPITKNVQNLSNVSISATIWARCNSGNNVLTVKLLQFFGDGVGASMPFSSTLQALNLTAGWSQYLITGTVPSVSGKNLGSMGACGNDALFLQIHYPLGVTTSIDFTKPCIYLGSNAPTSQYTPYDMIDSIINSVRTGYIMPGYDTVAPFGFLTMDDGTIGSAASGATSNSGRGASAESFGLYCLLWNNISNPTSNAWCPVSGGLGATAVSDFIANKPLQLPRALGRALVGSGSGSGLTSRTLGAFLGAETVTLSITEMPAHTHPPASGQTNFATINSNQGQVPAPGGGTQFGFPNETGSTGGGQPHNNMQPSSFVNYFIKL